MTPSCATRLAPLAKSPTFQAVFCLDEREESFRRHLEEVEPSCETFSTAGFFNVAMYHQGMTDAHPRPLCPVAIRPEHYVAEIEPDTNRFTRHTRHLNVAPLDSSATTSIWEAAYRSVVRC